MTLQVQTIYGLMPVSQLRKQVDLIDNESERTQVVMYFLGDQCVHRSAHVQLKRGIGIEGALAQL